ncbi:MAG: aldose epimerase family protein [Pirellulaceae bacterium]|nr:aldose epimerase family protein [Pirellulaceae bacterium]
MSQPTVARQAYGELPNRDPVTMFILNSGDGLLVKVMSLGATLMTVETADRNGQMANLVTTCPSLDEWLACGSFFGSTVGRFANRIAKGRFSIDGQEYQLATNNGPNHLHGGVQGFDKRNWTAETFQSETEAGVHFSLTSPDGDEGYPGTATVRATYRVRSGKRLNTSYEAQTDKPTVINLTNHAYWNLAGHDSGSIESQELRLYAQQYLDVDDGLIPTGELIDVTNTPLDFLRPTPIGKGLSELLETPARGFDHCFAVDGLVGQLRDCADVVDPQSGRTLRVQTTQPGVQLYTANHFDGRDHCGAYPRFGAFCLETQGFPDAPNQERFPSCLLEPGQRYQQETVWQFGIRGS